MTLVAGADVTKGRLVIVVLRDGNFDRATVTKTLADFLIETPDLEVLAVDICGARRKGDTNSSERGQQFEGKRTAIRAKGGTLTGWS
jgi:hypothetical protein